VSDPTNSHSDDPNSVNGDPTGSPTGEARSGDVESGDVEAGFERGVGEPDDVEIIETVIELVEVEFEEIVPPPPPTVHRFRFDTAFALAALPFGITAEGSRVEVADGHLRARFGPWEVHTPVDNVAAVHRTGPFSLPKVIGPPHVSLADRGLTFASTTSGGLCIEFLNPVPGILPLNMIRHPALTVTVEDPDGLARDLARAHR
jgi:hypothetical protein